VEELRSIEIVADAEDLARRAAAEFADRVTEAVDAHGRFTVALAGGSTPRALYARLAQEPWRSRLPWPAIHLFWGDERHVPPDHPDSNFRMVRETLLDVAPVPPGNVHRIRAEDPDAARAAAAYEAELRAFFQLAPGELPRFDLVLLGLGDDAHTASLFPGSAALHERERLVAAPWISTLQTFRITLTPPVLNRAAHVVFLVSGEGKAAALRAVLAGESLPERYPAQIVHPEDGTLLWLVDRAAASRLTAWKDGDGRNAGGS
jgi:6-phosphogluconolactonase